LEFGLGVDYKLRNDGQLLDLYAEVRAAYYFQDSSAWFINFGTKEKPVTARILSLFNAYSYLMLSARGIEAGAEVTFGFDKKYGPVSAKVNVYIDIWGYLSFQGVQIGAGLALGGQVDVSVFGIGFGISIATMLEGTVPKPFRIAGSVEVCVYVKVLVKKFEKCFDVDFVWQYDDTVESQAIPAIDGFGEPPVSAYHLGSGNTYKIKYFGENQPDADEITDNDSIPLDSYIDFVFKKGLDANAVANKLAGVTNAPRGNIDTVPPKPSYNDVQHSYKIQDVQIQIYTGTAWVPYHPYEALSAQSTIPNSSVNLSALKIGSFQKTDLVYNKIRLLAQTPFSYMETSAGGYIPEQMGLTSGTLFCREKLRKWNCTTWKESSVYENGEWYFHDGITVWPAKKNAKILPFSNTFGIPKALYIQSGGSVTLDLPKSSVEVNLKLFSFAQSVSISYQYCERTLSGAIYHTISTTTKTASDLLQPVLFASHNQSVDRVVIEPASADVTEILRLNQQIDVLQEQIYQLLNGRDDRAAEKLKKLTEAITKLKSDLKAQSSMGCYFKKGDSIDPKLVTLEVGKLNAELQSLEKQIDEVEALINKNCDPANLPIDCLVKPTQSEDQDKLLACLKKIDDQLKSQSKEQEDAVKLVSSLIQQQKNYLSSFHKELASLLALLQLKQSAQVNQCHEWKKQVEELRSNAEKIKTAIARLESGDGEYKPPEEAEDCGTYIHELCWMTEEDYFFNQSIPSQAAIEADYSSIRDAVEKVISPIWRPDSIYRVKLVVSDSVDGGADQPFTIYAGFKTKGPIGHYPADRISAKDAFSSSSTPTFDNRLEVAETSLKYYIDEDRSYPYGSLIGAKPLYFEDPKLRLFFTKPYVSHFFSNWPAYAGLAQLSGRMAIVVKDPADAPVENPSNDFSSAVLTTLPQSNLNWSLDLDPIVAEDIKVYSALRNPEILNPSFAGATCWQSGGDPIKPASKAISYVVNNLKPLKLYTAIVQNEYEGVTEDVHSYAFQTSRFSSFQDHINSYHLKDKDGNLTVDAIFEESVELNQSGSTSIVNLDRALEVVKNVPNIATPYNQSLTEIYSDPFQRLMEGHFKFKSLSPSSGLEFNFIKDAVSGSIFAIYVNSIEPINDPRTPRLDLMPTVTVIENGVPRPDYWALHSKDCSKVILMNSAKEITATDLRIRFGQLEWDGRNYVEKSFVITGNLRA
jgi:predicted translin family RNA/ssDNA-binding protein